MIGLSETKIRSQKCKIIQSLKNYKNSWTKKIFSSIVTLVLNKIVKEVIPLCFVNVISSQSLKTYQNSFTRLQQCYLVQNKLTSHFQKQYGISS